MGKDKLTIRFDSFVDTENAEQIKRKLLDQTEGKDETDVILDMQDTVYLSSAGLRTILQLKQKHPKLSLINVTPEIYEVFETTGFTQMMDISKQYSAISVDDCDIIGEGANGKIFRIDPETVVKTYKNESALEEIRMERENARLALVYGIPTAISYDIVRIGDGYGAVFELLNAKTFSRILKEEPGQMDWCVQESVEILKKLHTTKIPEGKLPSMKQRVLGWIVASMQDLPGESGRKLLRMAEEVPESRTMVHGDFHTKNIVLAGGEVLLIDMDCLAAGHPVFELAQTYNACIGFGEYDRDKLQNFLGLETSEARKYWHDLLRAYLDEEDEDLVTAAENKIRCIAYARLIDWSLRHADEAVDGYKPARNLWAGRLRQLLEQVDTLVF